MPAASLAKKMKLKPGHRAAIINAPDGYLDELDPPGKVEIAKSLTGKFDWVQIFVESKAQLDEFAPRAIRALRPDSLLWIAFPKGTSRMQTDLTRDRGWDTLQQTDLKWVNLVSVNETWSAFALRPYKPGEKRQPF